MQGELLLCDYIEKDAEYCAHLLDRLNENIKEKTTTFGEKKYCSMTIHQHIHQSVQQLSYFLIELFRPT